MYFKTLITLICLLLFVGCGAMPPHPQESKVPDYNSNSYEMAEMVFDNPSPFQQDDRQLTYEAFYRFKTQSPDSIHHRIVAITENYEGYILEATEDMTTFRVKSVYLADVVTVIESLAEITEKKIVGSDVTEQYYDLQLRLDNLLSTREKYLILLDQSKTSDEIIRIEKELERINQQIDAIKGKQQRIQHRIQYATITVQTSEKIKPGALGWIFSKFYKGVKSLFVL